MTETTLREPVARPAERQVLREWGISIVLRWAGPAIPLFIMAVMGYRQRWVTEDAFISLRVVENILAGNGPVFNRGERVEAYTHPLWVALLTSWGALGLPAPEGSVILGLVLSLVGLIAAMAAASRLFECMADPLAHADGRGRARSRPCFGHRAFRAGNRAGNEPGPYRWRIPLTISSSKFLSITLPLGALIFVSIPVVWDFVTSGLETGLSFAWLGVSYWLLARAGLEPGSTRRTQMLSAVVISLGPLVRPDLAIFSLGFLIALISCTTARTAAGRLRQAALLGLAAVLLPLGYQIFRMGYFAALVPNTAFAKEASDARWSQGWIYLRDFTGTYHLWLPLLIAAGLCGMATWRAWEDGDRPAVVVMVTPVVSAMLHAVYVVRVGGDFMHGRFLLPTLFGLLLPVMLVRVPLNKPTSRETVVRSGGLLLVAGWCLVAALWLRVPYQQEVSDDGLADERGIYVLLAGNPNPITLADYMDMRLGWTQEGRRWHDLAAGDPRVLVIKADTYPLAPSVDPQTGVVVLAWNIGFAGLAAGIDVHVTDRYGLSDPLASRLRLDERGRPGHEKQLDPAWAIARFSTAGGTGEHAGDVAYARRALGCGEVDDLLDAVTEPLTAGRFIDNLFLSWSLRDLRIPNDPETAVAELCR